MSEWSAVERDAPEFAARVRAAFEAGTNKTLATLRADGSPRVSGSELQFADGRVTLGMMPDSRKLADVRRDPRVAIHSPTIEPPEGTLGDGDAKLSGELREVPQPEGGIPGAYFELDVRDASLISLDEARQLLVIESWDAEHGYRRRERS